MTSTFGMLPAARRMLAVAAGSICLAGALLVPAASAHAAETPLAAGGSGRVVVRRFALITGASAGGHDRVPLRFSSSDARAISRVLSELGGLGPTETVMLLDVGRDAIRGGFERVKAMVAQARTPGVRTEIVYYYSGHSDETGLLLGNERISYAEVRAWVEETGADVRIAVLDSCASGALTRAKGGVHRAPFLVDQSSAARGHAYLTASAENESAQESDRLGAAYFTHYLVSGLRGAADVSHDGRVTLSEAYQYAFTETLARTQTSRGGPQHASYDFQLAGKGDLVMTDLRATSSSLVLPPELGGRLFVRDDQGRLVAEVHKLPAQPIELGLPAGRYRVTWDDNRRLSEAMVELGAGKQTTLATSQMVALAPVAGRSRGAGSDAVTDVATAGYPQPPRFALNLSLVPPLDSNGGIPSHNAFALGLFARSASLTGASLAIGGHYVDGDMRGVQLAGWVNIVQGRARGVQLAGLGNLGGGGGSRGVHVAGLANVDRGDVAGVRLAGAADWAAGSMTGAQVAGAVVTANGGTGAQLAGAAAFMRHDFTGFQAAGAVSAVNGNLRGVQLSGAGNFVRGEVRGLQVTGAVNIARDLTGGQISVLNVANQMTGLQLGVVNVARKARGVQFGLINVAEDAEGLSFGLITFVKNGIHEVDLSTNEVGATALNAILGTKTVYTRLGIGILGGGNDLPGGRTVVAGSAAAEKHYLLQWGIGGRKRLSERWFIDGEFLGTQYHRSSDWNVADAVTGSFRLLAGVRLAGSAAVVFGPTYNVSVGWENTDLVTGTGFAESVVHEGETTVRMYPGLTVGIRI